MGFPNPRTWLTDGTIRHRAVELGIVLSGLGAASGLMWQGSHIPRNWLSAAELWAFWSLLLAAAAVALVGERQGGPPLPATNGRARLLPAAALAGTFVLFSLPVAYLWAVGHTTYFVVGGLLPWSDASQYHLGARHLLHEGSLSDFSMRRPLSTAFLATSLGLMRGDLQAALVLQTWLAAAAAFLAVAAITRTHGLAGGTLALALLYEFARSFVGTTLSESLGLTFGCLGFAASWAAGTQSRGREALLGGGAALVALGLSTRAGAYGALAALVAWAVFGPRPRPAWRRALWPTAGIVLALLMNSALNWRFGTRTGGTHSNFAYILYGLAAGGKPWYQVLQDHPECAAGDELARSRCIYSHAIVRLKASPATAVRGYLAGFRTYGDRIFASIDNVSSPFWRREASVDRNALLPILALASLGAVVCLVRWKEPLASQLLLVGVAVLLCAPVLDVGEGRVYAATYPYSAALPAVGLALLGRRSWRRASSPDVPPQPASWRPGWMAMGLGAALAGWCTVGLWLVRSLRDHPRFEMPSCAAGLSPLIFSLDQGSAVLRVLSARETTQLPGITRADWRADPLFFGNEALMFWHKVKAADRVVSGYDYTPGRGTAEERYFWMVVPGHMTIPDDGPFLQTCARQDPRTQVMRTWRIKPPTAIKLP